MSDSNRPNLPPGSMAGFPMPRKRPVQAEEKSSPIKLIVAIAVLLIVAVAAVMMLTSSDGKNYAAPLAGDDKEIIETMKTNDATDARTWIDGHNSRLVGGMTREKGKRFLDELNELGAVHIYAPSVQVITVLWVELPSDPAKRKAIIERQQGNYGTLPRTTDVGQRYVVFNLGI